MEVVNSSVSLIKPTVADSHTCKDRARVEWTATYLRVLLTLDAESGTTGAKLGADTGANAGVVEVADGVRGLRNGDSNTKPISCRADFSLARRFSAMILSTASIQLRRIPDVMADRMYSPSFVCKQT